MLAFLALVMPKEVATPPSEKKDIPAEQPVVVCSFFCRMQPNGQVGCLVPPIMCREVTSSNNEKKEDSK